MIVIMKYKFIKYKIYYKIMCKNYTILQWFTEGWVFFSLSVLF